MDPQVSDIHLSHSAPATVASLLFQNRLDILLPQGLPLAYNTLP